MYQLIKPKKLKRKDMIATISISGGRAGDEDMLWRYHLGKRRLEEVFDLRVIETPNALRGSKFIDSNPKARVDDLYWALENPEINGIIAIMGGCDSYRLLPFIDYGIIRSYPKIFMGYSDVTTVHNIFLKAGITSYYGPNILTPLGQPGRLDDVTRHWIEKILFHDEVVGGIVPCEQWSPICWKNITSGQVKWTHNTGYRVINGTGKIRGRLLGGCSGPLQQIMGTEVYPSPDMWKDSILFLEIGIPYKDAPLSGLHLMRSLAASGIFRNAKGLICQDMTEEEEEILKKVICEEEGLKDFPILVNVDFGHRTPMTILPIGIMAEIDCDLGTFSILESAVSSDF